MYRYPMNINDEKRSQSSDEYIRVRIGPMDVLKALCKNHGTLILCDAAFHVAAPMCCHFLLKKATLCVLLPIYPVMIQSE
jgi:hypothetical protein